MTLSRATPGRAKQPIIAGRAAPDQAPDGVGASKPIVGAAVRTSDPPLETLRRSDRSKYNSPR